MHIASLTNTSRVGVIDLGTNTFNLMIAEVSNATFIQLHAEKEGVALGMGGINKGIISDDAFERGISCLKKFKQICDFHKVATIKAIGTSALRGAKNAIDFIQLVQHELGITIQIISGEEEAQLIYLGVLWSYDFYERAVIMDIGGGSTEFIFADSKGVEEIKSLNIGISRIIQELDLNDPLQVEDTKKIETWLEIHSNHYFDNKTCDILVGASGSFETFYEMIHSKQFPANPETIELPLDKIIPILDWIIQSNQDERDLHPFIIPIRKKMAPIAAVKTKWIMRKMNIQKVLVTPFALKEGVLKTIL